MKNVLSDKAQNVSGSPPPELPNYSFILCPLGRTVNVTYVMGGLQMSTAVHCSKVTLLWGVTAIVTVWNGYIT